MKWAECFEGTSYFVWFFIIADVADVVFDIIQSVRWLLDGNMFGILLICATLLAFGIARHADYAIATDDSLSDKVLTRRWLYKIHAWVFEAGALAIAFSYSADTGTPFGQLTVLGQVNVVSTFIHAGIGAILWLLGLCSGTQPFDSGLATLFYGLWSFAMTGAMIVIFSSQFVDGIDIAGGSTACTGDNDFACDDQTITWFVWACGGVIFLWLGSMKEDE